MSVDDSGTIRIGELVVPFSGLASAEARADFVGSTRTERSEEFARIDDSTDEGLLQIREFARVGLDAIVARLRERYDVTLAPSSIAGVPVDVIEPASGVPPENDGKVLINLHGGGMVIGRGSEGHALSIPVASLGGYRVISVDYRMAPEYLYPAGHDDIAAVYSALLEDHDPHDIGVFGHSAGGALAAQLPAWALVNGHPVPGAIAVLEAGIGLTEGWGDAGAISQLWAGVIPDGEGVFPRGHWIWRYWETAAADDPVVWPLRFPDLLAKYPPTALLNATRDPTLSQAVFGHIQLVKAGVPAELYVWEGMGHGMFSQLDTPEFAEAFGVVVDHFRRRLG